MPRLVRGFLLKVFVMKVKLLKPVLKRISGTVLDVRDEMGKFLINGGYALAVETADLVGDTLESASLKLKKKKPVEKKKKVIRRRKKDKE